MAIKKILVEPNKLLRKVFSDSSNYSLIEIKGKQLPHTFANYQNLKSIA